MKSTRPRRPQKFDQKYWDSCYEKFNEELFIKELKEWDEWALTNPYTGEPGFKLLNQSGSKSRGTTFKYTREVRCPNCGGDFSQEVTEGCFNMHTHPMSCPYCSYPFVRRA